MSLFTSLQKTTQNIASIIGSKKDKIDKSTLEDALIQADINYDIVEEILESLPSFVSRSELEKELKKLLLKADDSMSSPYEINLIIGVNGAGKTTSIAKLGNLYKSSGKSVLFGAGDTFRAAAIEQIAAWGERLGIQVVSTKINGDPSSVAFDTIISGGSKAIERIVIDTAGRIHTKDNLMNELEKISRVSHKAIDKLKVERDKQYSLKSYLVIDGTQGSSAINQAKIFSQSIKIDGIILTKLDGTSKGGAIFSIVRDLGIGVAYVGIGEEASDFVAFDIDEFVDGFCSGIFI